MDQETIALIKQKIAHIEAHPMGEFESGFVFGLRHILTVAHQRAQSAEEELPTAIGEVISLHEARRKKLMARTAIAEHSEICL